jgi:CheY-like chemotaxis protein
MVDHAFVNDEEFSLEEDMDCEFKEIKGSPPVQSIGKIIDEYFVAFLNAKGGSVYWGIRDHDRRIVGVKLSAKLRDELRQVVGQKIAAIAPPIPADSYLLPFHPVVRSEDHTAIEDLFVVEGVVRPKTSGRLYLTGSGNAYTRTLGGTKKLSGAELLAALAVQLQDKFLSSLSDDSSESPDLSWMPSLQRRAKVVKPLLTGSRILWVDDHPINNLYERTVLASLGVSIDLALSTDEAQYMASRLTYHLVLSDMSRADNPLAGLDLIKLRKDGAFTAPIIFYVGRVHRTKERPSGCFAITDRPDELLHYVFDALERRHK